MSLARRDQMFSGLDAEFGKAVYELCAPFAECREMLDAIAAVAQDELAEGERSEGFADARVWFDEAPGPLDLGEVARPVLGRVLLGQSHWRLEAIGAEKVARLRNVFESAFGRKVRFVGERRDDMVAHLKSKEPKYDRGLVPPRLLEHPEKVLIFSNRVGILAGGSPQEIEASFYERQERAFLDNPVPALDGRTPREAVRDPALRPRVIRLLKERVCAGDERNLETGGSQDSNWLLKELGAHEIIFEPPPPGRPGGQTSVNEVESGPETDESDDLAPWPSLPPQPFSSEEAVKRLLVGITAFESFEEAKEAMEDADGFLIEDVRRVVGDLLSEAEHELLETYLIQVWFAFVPPWCFGPIIEPEEIHREFGRRLEALVDEAGPQEKKVGGRKLLEEGSQPAMIQALAVQLIEEWKEASSRKWPKENRTLMVIILRTIVDLLDARCRADEP